MRRGTCALVLLLLAGCGGSTPTAPGPPSNVSLSAGRDTLRIFNAPQLKMIDGFTTSIMLCVSVGRVSGTDAISVPVEVSRDEADWLVRATSGGTLEMRLRETASTLSGIVRGQAESGDTLVRVYAEGGDQAAAATVTGSVGTGIGGQVHGEVMFSSKTGGYQFCSTNSWSLTRQ